MSAESLLTFIDLSSGERIERNSVPPLVLAIGNFDGVHLGHKSLIEKAVSVSENMKKNGDMTESGVFCFSAPPADYLMETPPPHICSLERKLDLFRSLGARYAAVGDFSRLCHMEAKDFTKWLRSECGCTAIVCGFNFRFGHMGKGTAASLEEAFGEHAFVIDAIKSEDGIPISSSRIRSLVEEGNVEGAGRLLGHPFSVSGDVLHGKALGRQLGLPTVNQNFSEKALIPRSGIYVTAVNIGGDRYMAVTNIGRRPTVEVNGSVNCETHLLDFEGDLYGKSITVEFLCRLRDEKKFSSEEQLRHAIEKDVLSARRYFKENK
ncbi:MAG: bifunctional riboflavin kinase/FAD synthetase [Clostridia bacterium]|nr:bifunctional riboflavin kinase/FAD synthetase [Clostridia bacterium]